MVHRYVWTHEKAKRRKRLPDRCISPNKRIFRRLPLHQLYCMSLVTFSQREQPVDHREVEVCTVFQRSFTATRIDVQCTGMHQVPHRVHSSIWCGELSLLPRQWMMSRVRPASNAILLCCYQMLEDIVLGLQHAGTLEVVIMKGMSVYHHLHLRRRGKLLSC